MYTQDKKKEAYYTRPMLINRCLRCKEQFRTYPCRIKTGAGKFCSQKCNSFTNRNGFKKGHKIGVGNKYNLGKKHTELHKQKIGAKMKGHPNYLLKHKEETKRKISLTMGGNGVRQIRNLRDTGTYKYKQWRFNVFKRDKWTCQGCRIVGGKLQAHHIKQWARYPKLRFTVSNGSTLCKVCHKLANDKQRNYDR